MADETKPADPAVEKKEEGPLTIARIMTAANVRDNFEKMLGKKAQGFITSVLQIVQGNQDLQRCEPMSIYFAAATAATMDLPINQNLGFAWIVPYNGKAQFQMGAKGFVQLGLRTAQYSRLNAIPVHVNQFKSWNALTEELDADFSIDGEGDVVGYCAYFKLINGFEKTVYWSVARVTKHAKKYSKSYDNPKSQWQKDFDSMALKTVVKNSLSKWGILSIEMQLALKVDQAIIKDQEAIDIEYPDNDDEGATDHKAKASAATKATANAIKNAGNK